jgi:hypothetical protein
MKDELHENDTTTEKLTDTHMGVGDMVGNEHTGAVR